MLLVLALPVFVAVTAIHRLLWVYAPTNFLARRVRARKARWHTAAALTALAACFLVAMHAVAEAVASGAPGWLNLFVVLLAWDAVKLGALAGLQALRCLTGCPTLHRRTPVRRRAVRIEEHPAPRLCS